MGVEHVIAFLKIFTYYEQNMVKSIIFLYYYNNVYQGWHERWQSMTTIKKGNSEQFKKTITIDERKERLRIQNRYGWNFLDYLYTPKKNPKLDKWETLLGNVQELIIKKLHGGMEMWCTQL